MGVAIPSELAGEPTSASAGDGQNAYPTVLLQKE
jgi:hypothetical protein